MASLQNKAEKNETRGESGYVAGFDEKFITG
jgi:hypothetical protein